MKISDFLELVFYGFEQGHVVAWTEEDRKARWFTVGQWSEMEKYALEQSKTKNVFFGCGVRDYQEAFLDAKRRNPNKPVNMDYILGRRNSILGIPGVWLQIDFRHPHSRQDLPANQDEAMALLNQFPVEPTLIVHSGSGLQIYWIFLDTWIFEDENDKEQAEQFSAGFENTMQRLAGERGWRLNPVRDLTRIFRLPQTLNHKDPANPKMVKVIEFNHKSAYDREFLEEYFDSTLTEPLCHKA